MLSDQSIKTGVSYFGNRNPRHFVQDLEEILRHNCNFVLLTFSENDQEYYLDTMAEFVELAKGVGLEVYLDPWGVGRVFGGEAYSSFALKNPHTLQRLQNGDPAPGCCMNHPEFREFMRQWIDDAVAIGADVLFWDEPHFYIDWAAEDKLANWTCRCQHCQQKYLEKTGEELPNVFDSTVARFREDVIVDFLTALCDYTKQKGARNAICLLPFQDEAFGVTNWDRVASIPTLDIFATDPYWLFFNRRVDPYVVNHARLLVELGQKYGKEPQIWIQNFRIPAGREDEIREAIAVAYAEGIRNFAAWSFYGSSYMSWIKSDNPEKVWDTLGEVYGELQRGDWE
jgi:hypothetical protein